MNKPLEITCPVCHKMARAGSIKFYQLYPRGCYRRIECPNCHWKAYWPAYPPDKMKVPDGLTLAAKPFYRKEIAK